MCQKKNTITRKRSRRRDSFASLFLKMWDVEEARWPKGGGKAFNNLPERSKKCSTSRLEKKYCKVSIKMKIVQILTVAPLVIPSAR